MGRPGRHGLAYPGTVDVGPRSPGPLRRPTCPAGERRPSGELLDELVGTDAGLGRCAALFVPTRRCALRERTDLTVYLQGEETRR